VHAQIVSDPILGCAESPIGLCTSGRIAGNHGLRGTTFFTGDSAGESPATAPNPAATLSYSGTLEITTARGRWRSATPASSISSPACSAASTSSSP
jgi:hypothetical protein